MLLYLRIGFGIQSCSSDDEEDSNALSTQEAQYIALGYLNLYDGVYILDLSYNDANKLGISEPDYSKMIAEIEQVNSINKELKKDPNIHLELVDPSNIKLDYNISRLKNSSESDSDSERPKGSLSVLDYERSTTITLPDNVNSIKFKGVTTCLISTFSIRIKCNGTTYSNSITSLPYIGGTCTFNNLPKGGKCEILYRTLCSAGGTLHYYY